MQYLLTPEEYEELKRTRITKKEYDDWEKSVASLTQCFIGNLTEVLGPSPRILDGAKFREIVITFIQDVSDVHRATMEK